jgi:hypothetical protein
MSQPAITQPEVVLQRPAGTMVRMHCHQPTRDYVGRRTAEGKTRTEIMSCLNRFIAREASPYQHALAAWPHGRDPACG